MKQRISIGEHSYNTYIATSESLDGKVFDALLPVFCLMSLTSNQFVFNRQLSRKPKNIKLKTSLIDTCSGYIYLKLG